MNNLVLLARYYEPAEAQIVKSFLHENDIISFVFDSQMNSIEWPMRFAMGGARVMVMSADYEAAKELLAKIPASNSDQPPLPSSLKAKAVFYAFLFMITGILPPPKKRRKNP